MGKPKDISGQRFGLLVAKEPVGKDSRRCILWRCECDCGNKNHIASTEALIQAGRQSCGCSRKHPAKRGSLPADTFGLLKPIKQVPRPEGRKTPGTYFLCRCECGNTKIVPRASLVAGMTKSCGCLVYQKSAGQPTPSYPHYVGGTHVPRISRDTIPRNNTSGVRGVYPLKGRWAASIAFKGRQYYLGSYDTVEKAAEARHTAEENLFGTFLDWYEKNIRPLPNRSGKPSKSTCMEDTK